METVDEWYRDARPIEINGEWAPQAFHQATEPNLTFYSRTVKELRVTGHGNLAVLATSNPVAAILPREELEARNHKSDIR